MSCNSIKVFLAAGALFCGGCVSKQLQKAELPSYYVVVSYRETPVLTRVIGAYSAMLCRKINVNNDATTGGVVTGNGDSAWFRRAFDTIPGVRVLTMQRVKPVLD